MTTSLTAQTQPRSAAPPALELDGVGVRFGGINALAGISLTVQEGERWAVIGPNGAGKTTLFRVISGQQRASSGRVSLYGVDCTRWSPHRRAHFGLSRTFQINNVFADLTVEQNLTVAAQAQAHQHYRFWRPVRLSGNLARRVDGAIDRTGLRHRRYDRASDLSHGESRQLEVALALARESRLLLLDEPAAGLATPERKLMKTLIADIPRSTTVVLIEHDMALALEVVDRVLCLNNGTYVAHGTPDEIRANDDVQQFYLRSAQ